MCQTGSLYGTFVELSKFLFLRFRITVMLQHLGVCTVFSAYSRVFHVFIAYSIEPFMYLQPTVEFFMYFSACSRVLHVFFSLQYRVLHVFFSLQYCRVSVDCRVRGRVLRWRWFYWCCYITVDSKTPTPQNEIWSYKLSLSRKTTVTRTMKKTLDFDCFHLLS
jgi:hypothetical protein